jgi:hypothetical protein
VTDRFTEGRVPDAGVRVLFARGLSARISRAVAKRARATARDITAR